MLRCVVRAQQIEEELYGEARGKVEMEDASAEGDAGKLSLVQVGR